LQWDEKGVDGSGAFPCFDDDTGRAVVVENVSMAFFGCDAGEIPKNGFGA
jgi:hypothetical protein